MPPFVIYNYHILGGSSGVWQLYPDSAGDINSQTGTTVEIKWRQNTGAIIYSENNCSDTLFLQECCDSLWSDDLILKDLSSKEYYPTEVANLLGGRLDSNDRTVWVNTTGSRKQIFIQGELDLSSTLSTDIDVIFANCDIFMGPGAVMYGSTYVFIDCTVQGRCAMWQGINTRTHGTIQAENSTFSDAEFCVAIFDVELRLRLKNSTFKRNFASIYAPEATPENSFLFDTVASKSSYIEDCTFNGLDPIILPPFRGQWGIPLNGKVFAGMLLNNFGRPNGSPAPISRIPTIPFSTNASTRNNFSNLNYGIYGVNSDMEVFNCTFSNIQPVPVYNTRRNSYGGTAVYSKGKIGSATRFLKVGEPDDLPNGLNYKNEFNDCRYGILTQNGIESYLNYNSFLHTASSPFPSGTGIYLRDADNRLISIKNNIFTEEAVNLFGPYSCNGIVISSATQTRKILDISENNFINQKIGVYLQNCKGRAYSDMGFTVADNIFTCNIDPADITRYNNNIIGLSLNNVAKGFVRFNQFYRPVPLNDEPSNYQNLVFGMNIVNSTDLNIAANDFVQYGTSMRLASICAGTTLKCNDMIANVQGILLDVAAMTTQGWPGESWDNKWDGFPTSNSVYNRAHGSVTGRIEWYNQGQSNTVNSPNRYSPEPVVINIIAPNPFQPSAGCYITTHVGDVESRNNRISKIVNGEMEYLMFPEETKYLDQEFVYYALLEDTLLLNSDPDYWDYLDSLNTIEFGTFEEVDEFYENGELLDALAALGIQPTGSLIDQYKYFTREIFLSQKISGDEEMDEGQLEELGTIAYTNAWEGGSGVFGARHLLEEQVFDLERNLRTKKPVKNVAGFNGDLNLSIYPNPASTSTTLFYSSDSESISEVKVVDLKGRIVYEETLKSNKVNTSSIPDGIYILQLFINHQLSAISRLNILR
jgi:hypothetical protein